MRTRRAIANAVTGAVLAVPLLAACGGEESAPAPEDRTAPTTEAAPQTAEDVLAAHGLGDLSAAEVVDHLDRVHPDDRSQDFMASVRARRLVISSGDVEGSLPLPKDRFYVSVAPYVDQTHDCTFHSLTTCLGEMTDEEVDIKVVERGTKAVLIDETVTTFDNGFIGMWLPRDIKGTITVSQGKKSGTVRFSTGPKAPTCLTTLRLR